MTVLNAKACGLPGAPSSVRAPIGLAAGLLAAVGGVDAAQSAARCSWRGPRRRRRRRASIRRSSVPGAISVSNIDFKRGDGGAGRLILHFTGDGAAPDLRNAVRA